ncbi:MAG TPA: glycosyltransferase family 39 protein [Spirochaetota bacterium]|nr:glycosyltransferase family 39 protein [Spirochaetota bacterium]
MALLNGKFPFLSRIFAGISPENSAEETEAAHEELTAPRQFPPQDIALLLLFLLIGYFIRKAMFVGMAWSDDYDYTQIAVMILDGRYNPVDIGRYNLYGWRFAMVFPLAFFFKIFNSTAENVAALWPLLASLGTSAALYVIGTKLFDSRTGLIAAILHLLYPADILFSTCVLTETPFNFLIALSVLFFVLGEESPRWWVKLPCFFMAGSMATWLLYGRPYGIMVIGAYGLFMMMRYVINLRYLVILLGFGATLFGIEYLVHQMTGLWFENFNVMKRLLDPNFVSNSNLAEHLNFYGNVLFNDRMHYPHFYIMIIGFGALFGWSRLGKLGDPGLTPETEKRSRQNGFLVLFWMMSILLYIEFGFMNLDHMSLMHKLDRYLTIISAPICLGAAPFLSRFSNRYAIALTGLIFTALAVWWYLAVLPPDLRHLIGFP